MDKKWKVNQCDLIHEGESIYRYIPKSIGNVVYCDTTQAKEEPFSPEEIRKRKMYGISFGTISLVCVWGLLYSHYIWASILTIIILFICKIVLNTKFNGTDYFVGKEGFSIVSFEGTRDNIISENTILFSELAYLFTGETLCYQNNVYMGTDYYFHLYYKEKENSFNVAYSTVGSYNDKKPNDPMNPDGSSEEYQMLKAVEKSWTSFFFDDKKSERKVNFAIKLEDSNTIYSDAITFCKDYIQVYDVQFNPRNTKSVYFKNAHLVLEHENHKVESKWFGLKKKESGDVRAIPLQSLGNRQAFMLLFDLFYKS